ncbi:MAG: zinc-dependent alcohol dehydrogenase family protein [Acidobacteriaceae bacterium]
MNAKRARSVRIQAFGGPEVLSIEEVEVPPPGPGEVRLSIRAIGLNRTEITLRSGRVPTKPALPSAIGFEAAGVIEDVGPDVSGWSAGDQVALVPAYTAAQYALYSTMAIAPARSLVKIPANVTFEQAAATWAAYGTAWAGLVLTGGLESQQTVLITAASSGVGLAAIQIARCVGARPITLTRTNAKAAQLLNRGAEAVIALEAGDAVAKVKQLTGGKGAELVLDAVGGPGFAMLTEATANGGMLILYGALSAEPTVLSPFQVFARDLRIRGFALPVIARSDEHLAAMTKFVTAGLASGSLRPVIDRTFRFEQIADAHRFLESGRQVGKVVVTV